MNEQNIYLFILILKLKSIFLKKQIYNSVLQFYCLKNLLYVKSYSRCNKRGELFSSNNR